MLITLSNAEIFNISDLYTNCFAKNNDVYFPAKLNFAIHRNFKKIKNLVQEITKARDDVIRHYGTQGSDGSFAVQSDKIEVAQKELNDLSDFIQEIDIIPISIGELDGIKLTPGQYEAIEFMINTETEAD